MEQVENPEISENKGNGWQKLFGETVEKTEKRKMLLKYGRVCYNKFEQMFVVKQGEKKVSVRKSTCETKWNMI